MARRVSLETERSFKKAARKINRYAKRMAVATPAARRQIGEEIMADVKASRPGKGVPVHTGESPSTGRATGRTGGTLRSTGQVTGPNIKGEVTLAFGGAAAPYAVVQHEQTDFQHNLGEARYLVRGMERWEPGESVAMKALAANAEAGIRAVKRSA